MRRSRSGATGGRPARCRPRESCARARADRGPDPACPSRRADDPLGPVTASPRSDSAAAWPADQLGLVLPTSLCSGPDRHADRRPAATTAWRSATARLSRYVALPHTEGCGVSGAAPRRQLYARTLIGYLLHPLVGPALLLEHGCEKTHNDYLRHDWPGAGIDPDRFGWASVQLDGGIEAVTAKAADWFRDTLAASARRRSTSGWPWRAAPRPAALGPVAPDARRARWRGSPALVVAAAARSSSPRTRRSLRPTISRTRCSKALRPAPSLAYGEMAGARPARHGRRRPTTGSRR